MADGAIALEIRDVTKTFRRVVHGYGGIKGRLGALLRGVRPEIAVINALENINLTVRGGETLALIGGNGSGKSTLLSLIANVMRPDSGTIAFPASAEPTHPRLAPLLEVGAGFHPDLTGVQNVFFNGSILGLTRAQMLSRLESIKAFADFEKPEYYDVPVRTYSSGMYVRLGFAVAVHTDPEIVLMDETFSVGDEVFQARCYEQIRTFQKEGRTILLVSHDMDAVRRVATRAVWIRGGRIEQDGAPDEVIHAYHAAYKIAD